MSTDLWRGHFGDSYHQRNRSTAAEIRPVFEAILAGIPSGTALEIGCGRGANLAALREMGWRVDGVEPNEDARQQAEESFHLDITDGDVLALDDIPPADLVFTAGLLIHIPPLHLDRALDQLIRSSNRYVLAIEYQAPIELEQEYRGHRDILWRRPYGKLYQYRGLTLVRHLTDTGLFYDGAEAWLLER